MTKDIEGFKRYLKSAAVREKAGADLKGPAQPFLTLSRQSGAGGHSLAQALLTELRSRPEPLFQGWHVLDRELCDKVIADPKLHVPLSDLLNEEFRGGVEDYVNQVVAGTSPQRVVYKRIFQTVRTAAAVGKVIVIGRGAAAVTRGLRGGIHLRLVAPREQRVAALIRRESLGRAEAELQADERDGARARLLRTFFRRNIEDPLLYDAVFNTGNIPLAALARLIAEDIRLTAERIA